LTSLVADHGAATIAPALAVLALAAAVTALWIVRWLGARRGLPIEAPGLIRDVRVHWTVAYLLAGGLILVMLDMLVHSPWVLAAGVTVVAIAGSAFAVHGAGCLERIMRRANVRTSMRVIAWTLLALSGLFWLVLPALALFETIWLMRPQPTNDRS
jgi:hypothetical protein